MNNLQKIGTILRRTKSFYYVDIGEHKLQCCKIKGNLFSKSNHLNKIAVGDRVQIVTSSNKNFGLIFKILPRRTKFSRRVKLREPEQVLVSNADTLLIVASIKNPPFRDGLVDRFLVAGLCGGLETCLILSKIDLASSNEIQDIKGLYNSLGCNVIATSIYEQEGLDKLKQFIKNRTSILSGHSGVGKSSLISAIFPNLDIRIGSISKKSGKGRHTTIMAEMFPLPQGGFIIDTPGIRTFEPIIEKNELDKYYKDFLPYVGKCKFKGCSHRHEPMCIIKEAVSREKISKQRYKSYCNLYDSL